MDLNSSLLILSLLFLLVEIVGTVAGFGSSILLVPLLSFFYPFNDVLLLTSSIHVLSNVSKIVLFKKGIDYKIIINFGIPSIVGVIIGAFLTGLMSGLLIEVILGVFLIVFSSLLYLFPDKKIENTLFNSFSFGGFSGFLAGLLGTGGAIRGLFLSSFHLSKNTFISTSAAIDFGVDFSRFFIYYSSSKVLNELWIYLPVILILSFAGSWIGKKILDHVKQQHFEKMVLGIIFVMGVVMIIKSF